MAKSKIKTEQIEDAVVVEETTNALTVAENIAANLPVISGPLFINGEEYSVAKVEELGAELRALLKKATPETYSSTAIWEEVKILRNRLVKMRTTPDNKRKELIKPFQDYFKDFKAATDAVGNKAKTYQDEADEALMGRENHEAEIARQEAEAKARRTESRKESLRALGGSYDIDSGKFAFGYTPEVVADMQIMEYDDPSWDNQYAVIKEAYDVEQQRLAKIKEQEEAEKEEALKKAEEAEAQVLKLRKKILELSGFVFDEAKQAYVKGEHAILIRSVIAYSDEAFDERIAESVAPVQQPEIAPEPLSAPEMPEAPQETDKAPQPINITAAPDPLGQVIAGMTGKQEDRVEELDGIVKVELVFSPENPYLDIPLNKTFIRLYSDELESAAMGNIPQEKVKAVRRTEDGKLTIKVIEF